MEESLEHRKGMQRYVEHSLGNAESTQDTFLVGDMQKDYYIGKEFLSDKLKFTYYFKPMGENESLLFLYTHGNPKFEDICKKAQKKNWENAIKNTYPKLFRAIKNGEKGESYSNVLIELPDYTKEERPFWAFATKLENVSIDNIDAEHVASKLEKLRQYADEVCHQIDSKDIGTVDKAKAQVSDLLDVLKVITPIISFIAIIIRLVTGVNVPSPVQGRS
ncbi:MAG: hypothetical protein IJ762_07910 [Bacteroidaceae bacterium]|nr:hypothetical protein [Bacteroidaceae bacterium]